MTQRYRHVKRSLLLSLAFLVGCSTQVVLNSDKAFVAEMIPHHKVGIELIDDGQVNSSDVRLRRIVFKMSSYHHQDVHLLERFAYEWSVTLVDDFPGRVSAQQIHDLQRLSGRDYDVRWLELMIHHHKGALDIASKLLRQSGNEEMKEMARRVISVQADEIVEMVRLLRSVSDVECNEGSAC